MQERHSEENWTLCVRIYNDNYEWYGFNPKRADYDKLTAAIDRYLSVFQDMSMVSQVSENAMQFKS